MFYEGPIWHVSTTGSDSNDGSEENPFATIQHGIDVSIDGETVSVSAGTYVENINFNGKNIVVQGENRGTTIIDGGQNGSVVTFETTENTTAILSGFTITNGSGYDSGGTLLGGGIYCEGSSPTFKSLKIIENYASNHGGGISCWYSSPSLENVMVVNIR